MDPSVPRSKRLLSDERSNIFVYMTGHGGNEFLKFQDNEEISAFDIADAFAQMYQKKRYLVPFNSLCMC
jgi:phosphatidylinositol glycan class K